MLKKTAQIFSLAVLFPLSSSFATDSGKVGDKAPFPEGFWEREYGTASPFAATYNVSIEVKSLDRAAAQIQNLALKEGGSSDNNNNNFYGGNYGGQRPGKPMRSISFQVSAGKGERLAKRVLDFGTIQQFNGHPMNQGTPTEDLRDRIKQLISEMESHKSALETMPIAKTLLTTKLNRYKQSQEAYEKNLGKALISVTLTAADDPK
ncbi:MAG: hypothetical protein HY077_02250 [Elusimicrobia bacterium]|nr:hypothetical protein [Elusimicrobiota bacterium]